MDRVFWEALCVEVPLSTTVVNCKLILEKVFHATDKDMELLALNALRSFLATLYPDEQAGPVKGMVASRMCEHCLGELKEMEKSSAVVAVKILSVAVEASSASLSFAVRG